MTGAKNSLAGDSNIYRLQLLLFFFIQSNVAADFNKVVAPLLNGCSVGLVALCYGSWVAFGRVLIDIDFLIHLSRSLSASWLGSTD